MSEVSAKKLNTINGYEGTLKNIDLNSCLHWSATPFVEGFNLACPRCSSEFFTLHPMQERKGNDNYEAWQGRGDLQILEFNCISCWHSTQIRLGFHKGQIVLYAMHDSEPTNFDEYDCNPVRIVDPI